MLAGPRVQVMLCAPGPTERGNSDVAFVVTSWTTLVRWLLSETARPETDYARACMLLFAALVGTY
jgi:hypothetical protein